MQCLQHYQYRMDNFIGVEMLFCLLPFLPLAYLLMQSFLESRRIHNDKQYSLVTVFHHRTVAINDLVFSHHDTQQPHHLHPKNTNRTKDETSWVSEKMKNYGEQFHKSQQIMHEEIRQDRLFLKGCEAGLIKMKQINTAYLRDHKQMNLKWRQKSARSKLVKARALTFHTTKLTTIYENLQY